MITSKRFALLAAAIFCLGLTACGGSGSSGSTVGNDWRKSGAVVVSGTIAHTGENSVYVLASVDANSVAFYRDEPEQILVDRVPFPAAVPDAQESFKDISFDDINRDGETDVSLSFVSASGEAISLVWTWDSKKGYVYRSDLSNISSQTGGISDYVGLWEYTARNLWLRIYDDGTWEFLTDQEDVTQSGTLRLTDTGITLIFDGTGDEMQLDRSSSGDLLDGKNGGVLTPANRIQSTVPCFTRNGLRIDGTVDTGTYLLKNGVATYVDKTGSGYSTGDCYWEVIMTYDNVSNGIREIRFEAICYVPYSSMKNTGDGTKYSAYHQLYDFYTGKWFTRIDDYKNSSRGKNHYVHTIEWNGQSDIIEFTRSSKSENNVDGWGKIVNAYYHVYMPAEYDGLVLALESLPDNYEDFKKFDSRHRAFAEASIMDVDLLDPYSCLFFRIGG